LVRQEKKYVNRIEYRPASMEDLGALAELWWIMQSSHDAYSPVFYKNVGDEESKSICRRYFSDLLKQEDCMMYVATCSAEPVGLIVAHFRERPPVYDVTQQVEVELSVVLPSYRRRGIFRNLLSLVEERARVAGVDMLEITVDHDNPAKRVYQNAGFCLRQDKMVKWL
jgi:GNAT superfamily N-acetyltransferase